MDSPIQPSVLIQQVDAAELASLVDTGTLMAVLDACNEPAVVGMTQVYSEVDSLYQGQAAEDYSAIAPYLFSVDEKLLKWFNDQLQEKPSGIFLTSTQDRSTVRTHLRRLLKVEVPNDKQFYFRFYDPRVLPGFLATAPGQIVSEFFGCVDSFLFFEQGQLLRVTAAASTSNIQQSWPVGYRLNVSQDHLQAMDRHSKDKFARRLEKHLVTFLPEQGASLDFVGIEKRVETGMKNAEMYCLKTEREIATYVELMCTGFPDHREKHDPPVVRELMFDRRLSVDDRLNRLKEIAGASDAAMLSG